MPAATIRKLARLLTRLERECGPGVRDEGLGKWRFHCPVCLGGDWLWRPLCVADDGRIWCDAALGRKHDGYDLVWPCTLSPDAPISILLKAIGADEP